MTTNPHGRGGSRPRKNKMVDPRDPSIHIPGDLKDFLDTEAANQGRSFSSHVVWLLNQHWEKVKAAQKSTQNDQS